jgi:hypothetical protein
MGVRDTGAVLAPAAGVAGAAAGAGRLPADCDRSITGACVFVAHAGSNTTSTAKLAACKARDAVSEEKLNILIKNMGSGLFEFSIA